MPRDAGGSIEITEGTGPLRAIISTGDLLELFKVDTTFRIQTPEGIDPGRTNPNAPFTVSLVQNVGTSNRIVARVLLQGDQILNVSPGTQAEKDAIRKQLHDCKEHLLRCETSANQLRAKIDALTIKLETTGIPQQGRVIKPFPHVENLEADCSAFLVEVNRAIKVISGLPSLFIQLERKDRNFDYLGQRLAAKIGADEELTKFVNSVAGDIARLVDLRNFLEHPDKVRTVVNNFKLLPDGTLNPPTWHLSGQAPRPIAAEMVDAIHFLVCVSELMLIYLVMYSGRARFAFSVEEIAEDQRDRDFPVKYKVLAFLKQYKKPGEEAT
jgi:hypothetical protein